MQIPMIGSLYSSMKNMQLSMKWQSRQKNMLMPKNNVQDPKIEQYQAQMKDLQKSNILSGIDSKLKSGSVLTDDEMEYLRLNSPQLYQQALEIVRERAKYKKELENCKTKDDVQRLNASKMQSFLSEAKAVNGNPNIPQGKKQDLLDKILRRMMGILNEHAKFTQSKEYADLPKELDLIEEKKDREKQKTADSEQLDEIDYTKELLDFLKDAFSKLGDGIDENPDAVHQEKPAAKAETVSKPSPPAKTDAPVSTDAPVGVKTYNAKGEAKPAAAPSPGKVKAKISAKV